MATSLAEQLQRLAVPQSSALKRDKKRPSLLFDPKKAAELSREIFYQIGLEGLEELIQKNEIFSQFKDGLFHVTSKEFERSVQNAEANEKLNKSIKKFLLLLSPYFMLNCTHKALEWLVNRFSIHEYNKEDLLMLCLPYHESNIFVRVIQIVVFKNKRDAFYFLKQLQLPGTHLPKQILLSQSASNNDFLKFVSKYIKDLLKCQQKHYLLTVAFNFYCTVFSGALEYSNDITEDQVSQLLPLLLKGLNSPIADFCAASYVITARLVSKTNLSNKLLDKFVEKVSEVKVDSLKTEACLLLLVIYQSQKQYTNFPTIAIISLSEKEWLPKVLSGLQSSGSFIYPFLERLITGSFIEGVNNDLKLVRDMVKACLDQLKVKDEFVSIVLNSLLDAAHQDISAEAKEWSTGIIESLETQYPSVFDKEVYGILSNAADKKSIKRRKCLTKLLKTASTCKGKFDVFGKLYHPNPCIRGEAIKFLLDNYDTLRDADKEMINNFFIDGLRSDDKDAVKETLKVIKKTTKIDRDALKKSLGVLSIKYHKDRIKWGLIYKEVTNMLFTLYPSTDWGVFLIIFPFLLPATSDDLPKAKKLLEMPFIANHDLFKSEIHRLKSVDNEETFVKSILKVLSKNADIRNVSDFVAALKGVPEEIWDNYHKYIGFLILSAILPQRSSPEIVDFLPELFENVGKKFDSETTTTGYIQEAIKGKFPVRGFLNCLITVTYKIEKEIDLKTSDFTVVNAQNRFFLSTIRILLDNDEKCLETFLKKFCDNDTVKIEALLNVCLSQNDFKIKILNYIESDLQKNDEAKNMLYIDQLVPTFLLALLSDPDETMRSIIIDIFTALIDASTRKGNSFYHLLNAVLKYKEEIILDHEQLPLILFKVLDPSNTKKDKKTSSDLNSIRNQLLKTCCQTSTPAYLKSRVLTALSSINTFEMLEQTSGLALSILAENTEIKSFNAEIIVQIVARVTSSVINKLNFNTTAWKFIETFIKNDEATIYNSDDKIAPSVLMLNQLDRDVFNSLDDIDVVKTLLDAVVEKSATARDPEILPAAIRIFKHIDLDATWITGQLIGMRDASSSKIDVGKKKRRIGVAPTVDILDTLEWKKGVAVLEFIQDKKKIRNAGALVAILFDVLKRCLDFDEQSVVEYPKQLLLSLILHCFAKTEETIPDNVFDIELIVQCIRASQNPQTHHHALLVLTHTAHLVPTQVLHHMMAIFTFMGSSVLRHDDAYSFQIIFKIIDTVIPIIVDEREDRTRNVTNVLRVFVDALLDVPDHRRTLLFKRLLEKIDVKENLFRFLLLVFEAQVAHAPTVPSKLDVASDLCKEFAPDIVIYTGIELMKHLQVLPDENEDEISTFRTPKDFRHYKYVLIKFVSNLLSSPQFVASVASLSDDAELQLESLFKNLIVVILQYVQRISKVAERNANTPQAQYWKVMLHLSYDILDSVNALLTAQMFLLVTKGLMVHKLSTVRRRILELLNNKLQYNQQFFEDCDNNDLFSLIPPIVSIVETVEDEIDSEQETIVQTALLSLKLLVKSLAWKEPEKFVQILEFVTGILRSGKVENNVLASVVLCLAELCVNLKGHAIASLPEFMPALVQVLKKQKSGDANSVLLRSSLTAVEKILDSVPLFLSPYLEKLLTEMSLLMSRWIGSEEKNAQPFVGKLSGIKRKIGASISLRTLLPAVEGCYTKLARKCCYDACCCLLDVLAESVNNAAASDINSNLNELTNFFLDVLKFRADSECDLNEANAVEDRAIAAFTVLVLKLSENSFRPLYYKVYDWAVRSGDRSERVVTFYNFSDKIARSLKGLFLLFAGHFVGNAAQILDACNTIKSDKLYFDDGAKNALLLEKVLSTLDALFLYDTQKFVNRDRFDLLMQPLVDQLENTLGGTDASLDRNEKLVVPCLVRFAVAAADDSLWKQLNYQVLLKMRHDSANVRLCALRYLNEFVNKLGEDFLPLLPETIPFLAELLEDEDEDVEKACRKAVQEMEKVLGEPLQKYF